MTETIFFKGMRLITPEGAAKQNIPGAEGAESPIFISSDLRRRQCHVPTCEVTFSPLPYYQRRETRAQHFHSTEEARHEGRGGGGIYVYTPSSSIRRDRWGDPHWLIEVQPVGKLEQVGTSETWRAEGVILQHVFAYTEDADSPATQVLLTRGLPKAQISYTPITEGTLVRVLPESEQLIPVTDTQAQKFPESSRYCRFQIQNGRLAFSHF